MLTADRKLGKSEANTLVDRMLDDAQVKLLVAHEPGQPETIVGWIAYTPMPRTMVLHYAYVRDRARRRGVAETLWMEARTQGERLGLGKIVYTMRGPDADALLTSHPSAIYLPIEQFLSPGDTR